MLKVKDPAMREYLHNSLMLTGGVALLNGVYNYLSKDYTLTQSFAMNAPEAIMFGMATPSVMSWFGDKGLPPAWGMLLTLPVSLITSKQMTIQAMHEFHRQNLHEALVRSEAELENPPHRINFHEARKQVSKPPVP